MLTPVDLQQKKFQHGMGYTKKDVDSFFDIVVMSYTELYKSNAELTNQVKTLTDSLVHYRTTESKLQKSLMLAEKNAEEATKNANDKAKIIENDAKIKANNIVHQAREELDRIEDSIEGIKQQYRDYTMAFKNLMDSHLQFLATNPINEELGVDFDEIMKDAKYFNQVHLAVKTPDQVPLHPLEEILRAEKNLHSAVAEAQEWAIPHLVEVQTAAMLPVILLFTQKI